MKIKVEGYEIITKEEYWKLPSDEGAYFFDCKTGEMIYLKKYPKGHKEKVFPKVFEGKSFKFKVFGDGDIMISWLGDNLWCLDDKSIKAGKEAFECADKIRSKNAI